VIKLLKKVCKSMPDRRSTRFKAAFNAGYSNSRASMLLPCRIVEISLGGSRIELFAKHDVLAGSTIELHIEVPGLSRRIVAAFRCLWTRPAKGSGIERGNDIGGCFIGMSPEDRHLLLDHAQKGAAQPCKPAKTLQPLHI
jgi:hypothetical protein